MHGLFFIIRDEEEDGEYEPPQIRKFCFCSCCCNMVISCLGNIPCCVCLLSVANPVCEKVGCGEWRPAMIPNPAYKGKWKPDLIANPDYDVSDITALL